MKRIIVGSMPRSGSTWTFNACRLLAEHAYGKDRVNASDFKAFEPIDDVDVEIIKAHTELDPEGAIVITTVRDMRDAFCSGVAAGLMEVASYPRRGMVDGVLQGAELLFAQPSLYWHDHADRVIRFENMMIDKVGTLASLAKTILPEQSADYMFDGQLIESIAMTLEILPLMYHEYTPEQSYLFGRPHTQGIGIGGYIRHMPWLDSQALLLHFRDWFDRFGYTNSVFESVAI